jgi:ankyrin repeat protein
MTEYLKLLDKNLLIDMVLSWDLKDVLHLSLTGKYYYNLIFSNEEFWKQRIEKDYGEYGHRIRKIRRYDLSWRQYYKILSIITYLGINYQSIFNISLKNNEYEYTIVLLNDNRIDHTGNNNHYYSIMSAVEGGSTECVSLLLADGRVDPTVLDHWSLRRAAEWGHIEIVKMLLPLSNPEALNNWAIRGAAKNGHTDVVKLLLNDDRVDPSDMHDGAIKSAVERGHADIVEVLLSDDRVGIESDNYRTVRMAHMMNHMYILELLLNDKRMDKNKLIISLLNVIKEYH